MGVSDAWTVHNPDGDFRVIVTKVLPGDLWLRRLQAVGARVEVCEEDRILSPGDITAAIGARCDGVIGQLTERWDASLFQALASAGGRAYSNYAVGFDNVDVAAASASGIPVGNTPGVLTDATAEMAATLTLAAARRVVPADAFMRAGRYEGWLPTLFMGEQMRGKTLGLLGAGRIGRAYARIMVQGFGMHLRWFDPAPGDPVTPWAAGLAHYLDANDQPSFTSERATSIEDVLRAADVVSLHMPLTTETHHVIDAARLAMMKPNAVLVNTSRGPVIDEAALVSHCREHPRFRVGLDVFEEEPHMQPGLAELENAVVVPHIASATVWTREAMATLAASNVAGLLAGYPLAEPDTSVTDFLSDRPPRVVPSVVNPDVIER
jgi:hydroxypyruvate reductase 1